MKSSTPPQLPNSRSAIAAALVSFSIDHRSGKNLGGELGERHVAPTEVRREDQLPALVDQAGHADPDRALRNCAEALAELCDRGGERLDRRARIFRARPRLAVDDAAAEIGGDDGDAVRLEPHAEDDAGRARDRERHRRPPEPAHRGGGVRSRDEAGFDELRGDGGDGRLVEAGQHRKLALRAARMAAERLHQKHGVDAPDPGGIHAPAGRPRLRHARSRPAIVRRS